MFDFAFRSCCVHALFAAIPQNLSSPCSGDADIEYAIWRPRPFDACPPLNEFYFLGVRPRVDICRAPGTSQNIGAPRRAALHGYWYVAVRKEGTLEFDANWKCRFVSR